MVETTIDSSAPEVGLSESPRLSSPRPGDAGFDALPLEIRVLAATMDCVGRWGVSKTTIDDIARAAGCGRATVYRLFPGGKLELFRYAAQTGVATAVSELARVLGDRASLRDLLVDGVWLAARLAAEDPALHYLLAHEPQFAAPQVSFQRFDVVLAMARSVFTPLAERHTDTETAERAVELALRIAVSYTFCPTPDVDLTDRRQVEDLIDTFVIPALVPVSSQITLS